MTKKFFMLLIFLIPVWGCSNSSNSSPTITAEKVIDTFKNTGLPITHSITYTAETDPNKLLGRPGQYIEKANWADERINQPDINDPIGGTVEVFNSSEDLERRKNYVQAMSKSMSPLAEYSFTYGNVLVRLSKELAPEQAAEYERVIKAIK